MTLGETAAFQCNHISADVIGWRINGIPLGSEGLQGVNIESNTEMGGQTLNINAIPAYNNSIIECIATFVDGRPPEFASSVILNIQGNG